MQTVPFLDVAGAAAWIREQEPELLLARLVGALETDFRRWSDFDLVPRLAMHSPAGVIEVMPVSDATWYAFKYVNGHPANPLRGLQTVTAFGVLAEVATGQPVLVAEMTLLTALRTAATSALAARLLARPDSEVMAMVGVGAQAEFQALAMRSVLGIRRLRVHDTDPRAVAKLVRHLEPRGFEVHVARDATAASRGADVITTCTAAKRRAHVLTDAMVAPGTHVNAVGGDCPGKTELEPRLLEQARVFCELEQQTRIEGEIQQMPPGFEVGELWQLVTGRDPGRRRADDVTVFDSVGFALEDLTVLRLAQQSLVGSDLVRQLDLVATPEDPKDLFALVAGRPPVTPAARAPGPVASRSGGR